MSCKKHSFFSNFSGKPDFTEENKVILSGAKLIAGVDEAGRGPLAGPVVSAAIILDPDRIPAGIDDSKRMTACQRNILYDELLQKAMAVSACSLSAPFIDKNNIRNASLEAMRRAVMGLAVCPSYALIDGKDIPPHLPCKAEALIKGDRRSLSIAAASVIAKVLRDRMMIRTGCFFPSYQLERHVGYATVTHRRILVQNGPIDGFHRHSFAPVTAISEKKRK